LLVGIILGSDLGTALGLGGFVLLIVSITVTLAWGTMLGDTEGRIESYCPACLKSLMWTTNTTSEKTGKYKKLYVPCGVTFGKHEYIRETTHKKCPKCGYEMSTVRMDVEH